MKLLFVFLLVFNGIDVLDAVMWVIEPTTTILGGPEIYMDVGSTINLTCLVRHSPEPPAHVFWTQNQQVTETQSVSAVADGHCVIEFARMAAASDQKP